MKHACFVSMFLCLTTTFLLSQSNPVPLRNQSARVASPISASQADPKAQARILDSYGKLPLSFEANHGQADKRVKFLSRTGGYTLFLTGDEAVLALNGKRASTNKSKIAPAAHTFPSGMAATKAGGVLRMKLRNANPAAKVTGLDELAGTSNYFIGNDPAKWRTNVPIYAKVKYEGIYSGIDLVYYGNQRQLEYDFIVALGADPRRIQFDVRGMKRIRRDVNGDLVLKMGEDEIRWHKPVAYQEKDGARRQIAARYTISGTNRVGFEVAKYDASRPLYIDPVIYSTYIGGMGDDVGMGIAVDSTGNAYITGYTASIDFPTMNPLQPASGGGAYDAFVAKINPTGSALVYSTYLGGSNDDRASGIAVDSAGHAYVSGQTSSVDFPTMNPLQATNHGAVNAFVSKLNPAGSALVYSTYLGGSNSDQASGIAVNSAGNAFVTGWTDSTDFPTKNPLQPTYGGGSEDAFVSKLNVAGSALVYSTYLGGSGDDQSYGIGVDSLGKAYITGTTSSTDFPTINPLQPAYGGGSDDAFVAKLNAAGSALVYSTYLGGSGEDAGQAIAVDSAGKAYVTGYTYSTDFPTTPGVFGTSCNTTCAYGYAFVTKLNPSGSAFVYSTYLGPGGRAIAVDPEGYAYDTGGPYAYLAKLNPTASEMVYIFPLGLNGKHDAYESFGEGIAVDSSGTAYVVGKTNSDFPTVNALQPVFGGGEYDGFVSKVFYAITTTQLTSSRNPSISGQWVTFTATVSSPSGGTPTGIVSFYQGSDPSQGVKKKLLVGGVARWGTKTLSVGTDVVTARYGLSRDLLGDSNFSGSTSAPLSQVVLPATAISLSSSLNPSIYGQAVTFIAVITSANGTPPDGETITFMKGATVLGTGMLSGGSASFTTSTLPGGTDYIKAVYGGDSNFGGSKSPALPQVVNKATTTTTLVSSLNPSNVGQSVTFTASVTPQFSGTVTGTVTFYDGATALKTMGLSGGAAKFTTKILTSVTHTITATYNGSTSFNGSSASLTQTVN
jgi:hypothetical protein